MTLKDDSLSKAPFPWFGGKRKAAPLVWNLLGDVEHYVEPFAGSLAVLLERPHPCNRTYHSETVNDLDGFIVNAWRSIQFWPEQVAAAASWPVSEADKTARQIACQLWKDEKTLDLLAGDPDWCDPKMAGWWMWGVSAQIGAIGGPWTSDPDTGRIFKQPRDTTRIPGVSRDLPHLSNNGKGVNHAGTRMPGVSRDLPHLGDDGRGVNRPQTRMPGVSRDLPHLSDDGKGVNHAGTRMPGVMFSDQHHDGAYHPQTMPELTRWMLHISARLRHVRILNGDWKRLVTTGAAHTLNVRMGNGVAGVFLDPPYAADAGRSLGLYDGDTATVDPAGECLQWCLSIDPDNPKWRIVLAGYDGEDHSQLLDHGWTEHEWFIQGFLSGGMGNTNSSGGTHQQHRERLWASPQCLDPTPEQDAQLSMFT